MKSLFFMVVMLCVVSGCTNNNEKINRCIEGATFVEQMAELRDLINHLTNNAGTVGL